MNLRNIFLIILSYLVLTVTIFLSLNLETLFINIYIISAITPIPTLILILLIVLFNSPKSKSKKEKTMTRYTMNCRNCNWEWMSNTSGKKPQQCPHCKERNYLEIIGWRKIQIPQKRPQENLKKFIK